MDKSNRLYLLDAYRGFVVLNMVAYHFCYDYFVLIKSNSNWIYMPEVYIWEQFICISFIFLSGFVWNFNSNGKLKRGITVSLCGILITAVTAFMGPDIAIFYGVLFLIGASMLIMIVADKLLIKLPSVLVFIMSLLAFLITFSIPQRHLGFHRIKLIRLPDWLYKHHILVPFGFLKEGFVSADYFPILPWFFLFVSGYALHRICKDLGLFDKPSFLKLMKFRIPALTNIGQHSLLIYLLHQPICMGILMLFSMLIN